MRKLLIVLGVPIDDLIIDEALNRIESFIAVGRATKKCHQIATINADFVVNSLYDPDLRRILQQADMATADGMPLVWGARLLGVHLEDRVTGADLVPALAERSAQKGFSIYLLGAKPGVAARAAEVLRDRYPGVNIVGVVSPPYGPIREMDRSIINDIKAARPDILMVALGNPKQEKWIDMYAPELNVPVCLGIGGTLDFIAGVTKRAPVWMQRSGVEWIYRLMQEPRRLWKRYVQDLFYFSSFFVRQWWSMRQGYQTTTLIPSSDAVMMIDQTAIMNIQGRLDVRNYATFMARAEQALALSPFIIVNLANTAFLDSSAMGALVTLANRARGNGGDLWLVNVPKHIADILSIIKLDQFFDMLDDVESALQIRRTRETLAAPKESDTDEWQVVKAPRIVDGSLETVVINNHIPDPLTDARLIIDLSDTIIMSQDGINSLLRLDQKMRVNKGQLRIAGCSGDVLQSFQSMHLDTVLTICQDVETAATS